MYTILHIILIFSGLSENRNKYFEFVNIGYWTSVLGFVTHELAFPHVKHYFRNITLDIITMHVSKRHSQKLCDSNKISSNFNQRPPWQILKKDQRGEIIQHSGIVMEILKELSRMLNFSYILHDASSLDANEDMVNLNDTVCKKYTTYISSFDV